MSCSTVVSQVFRSAPPSRGQGVTANMQEAGYEVGEAAYRMARGGISQDQFLLERQHAFEWFGARFGPQFLPSRLVFLPASSVDFNLEGRPYNLWPFWFVDLDGQTVGLYRPAVYRESVRLTCGNCRTVQVAEHQLFLPLPVNMTGLAATGAGAAGLDWVCRRRAAFFANPGADTASPEMVQPFVNIYNDPAPVCAVHGFLNLLPDEEHPCPEEIAYRSLNQCETAIQEAVEAVAPDVFLLEMLQQTTFVGQAARPGEDYTGSLTIFRNLHTSFRVNQGQPIENGRSQLTNVYSVRFPAPGEAPLQ